MSADDHDFARRELRAIRDICYSYLHASNKPAAESELDKLYHYIRDLSDNDLDEWDNADRPSQRPIFFRYLIPGIAFLVAVCEKSEQVDAVGNVVDKISKAILDAGVTHGATSKYGMFSKKF